ncbi:hypothetical protein DPV78_006247 [Talaromyces pinophilus]|nr:hypothetical protein DPV78_006247 [Talaromyces pinophilus]
MPIPESESECKICHEVDTHYTRDCPKNFCFRCKQRGHWSNHCPNVKCYVCGEMGHKAKACQKQCDVCFKTGHKTEDCRHKDSGTTFIQNPMKRKVRNVSPGIVMPVKEQIPRPQKKTNVSEGATKLKSKTSKAGSGSNAEKSSKLDTEQKID